MEVRMLPRTKTLVLVECLPTSRSMTTRATPNLRAVFLRGVLFVGRHLTFGEFPFPILKPLVVQPRRQQMILFGVCGTSFFGCWKLAWQTSNCFPWQISIIELYLQIFYVKPSSCTPKSVPSVPRDSNCYSDTQNCPTAVCAEVGK